MAEFPIGKEREAREIISSLLAQSKNPCVCFSGGKNSVVLLHMVRKHFPRKLTVIYADSGNEFPEVLSYIQKMKKIWGFSLTIIEPGEYLQTVSEKQTCPCELWKGLNLPGTLAKNNFDGIFVGETSESNTFLSDTLQNYPELLLCTARPLMAFTGNDIWDYIRTNTIPYCSLYDKGYKKIGCKSCSPFDHTPEKNSLKQDDEKIIREKLHKLGYL